MAMSLLWFVIGPHVRAAPQSSLSEPIARAIGATLETTGASLKTLAVEELVDQVLQHNPGIDATRAAADAAGARTESASALDDPLVNYTEAPRTTVGFDQRINQSIQISQKFPWPGTLNLRAKAAAADADAAASQVVDVRLRLTARARATYAEWYYVHRALAIHADNSALVARLRSVAQTAYASGQSPQQDVLQAEVELARLRNVSLQLRRLRHTVQAKINALQNLDPLTEVPPPGDLPMPMPLPKEAALRDAALARYPMLQSLDTRVTASRERVELAHKDNHPNWNLSAGYNSFWGQPAQRLIVGVGVTIPFGGNHRGAIEEANARLREAQAKLADARNELLSDLDQTYLTATQDADTIELYTGHLLPLATLNLQAAQADYSTGSGDFLKLITAEQQDLTVRLELARACADLFTQRASLDYQTGGPLAVPSTTGKTQEEAP